MPSRGRYCRPDKSRSASGPAPPVPWSSHPTARRIHPRWRGRLRVIGARHVLGHAVVVHVDADPVHVQQMVVGVIGDHAEELTVEPPDDRLRVRPGTIERQVKGPFQDRGGSNLQLRAGFAGVVRQDGIDDEFVHDGVVGPAVEQVRETVLFAGRAHEDRSCVLDRRSVRVAADNRDALPAERRERLRRDIRPLSADQNQPVLEIRLGEHQRPLALRILPCRRAAIEPIADERVRKGAGIDDGGGGAETDTAQAGLDEIQRHARVPGCRGERRPLGGHQA